VRIGAVWAAVAALVLGAACTSVTTVRLQPEAVQAGPGLRPLAAIQANASSMYVLFVPVAGEVSLDRVVNQLLIVRAKTLGADKIAQLELEITPDDGIWALRKLLGWRSARASGIAVQITDLPPDPDADLGPEPATEQPAAAP
jgi:hypothetical protein